MKHQILSEASKKTASAIFLSGGTRTGTSMMARLIYSLDHVECFHEPAFLYAFFYMMNQMDEAPWKLLLEGFVYEELLLSALAGRRLNFNENDESCVFHSRPRSEIADRLSRTHRHHELVPRACEYQLAFKMPETLPQLDTLRRYYPDMTFLVMLRRPESVIASLIQRGWYSDRQMRGTGGEWLFRETVVDGLKIPAWVPDSLIEEFVSVSEVDRCAMCYIEQYKHLVERRDCTVADFEELMHSPRPYFGALSDRLGRKFGPMTAQLLEAVREPSKDRSIPVNDISPERRRRMAEIYEACRHLSSGTSSKTQLHSVAS
jgi:hypothetical protein